MKSETEGSFGCNVSRILALFVEVEVSRVRTKCGVERWYLSATQGFAERTRTFEDMRESEVFLEGFLELTRDIPVADVPRPPHDVRRRLWLFKLGLKGRPGPRCSHAC